MVVAPVESKKSYCEKSVESGGGEEREKRGKLQC